MDAVKIESLVCYCNTSWGSTLPPPPCPYHAPMASIPTCGHGWWIPAYSPWTHTITVTSTSTS